MMRRSLCGCFVLEGSVSNQEILDWCERVKSHYEYSPKCKAKAERAPMMIRENKEGVGE